MGLEQIILNIWVLLIKNRNEIRKKERLPEIRTLSGVLQMKINHKKQAG